MKIIDLQVMKGPSYWSARHHKLIVLKGCFEASERKPCSVPLQVLSQNEIPVTGTEKFDPAEQKQMFLWELIAQLACRLQPATRAPKYHAVLPGRTEREHTLIFSYTLEKTGRLALSEAIRIAELIYNTEKILPDDLSVSINCVAKSSEQEPYVPALLEAAACKGIPVQLQDNALLFGHGVKQIRTEKTRETWLSSAGCDAPDAKKKDQTFWAQFADAFTGRLFSRPGSARIPVIAVTGTNGKTTTTRLIAHIAATAGFKVGYTTTDGIFIHGEKTESGDCTGPVSTEKVLFHPEINFAVLECARGGILRAGLAFDKCDVSIVTNVRADHLGLKEINTIAEMARVKAVVPSTTAADGWTILNAEDPLVYQMKNGLSCNIALFSLDATSPELISHCTKGGLAATVQDGKIVIIERGRTTDIEQLDLVPLTIGGRADCMIRNILPAILAAKLRGIHAETIKAALAAFLPTPEQSPGRMNIFDFGAFRFMVDYAHNTDGILEIGTFLAKTGATENTGVIGIAGDRRNEDIIDFGACCAKVFDRIIIRHDADMRGRSKEEMTALLMEGIQKSNSEISVHVVSAELEAVQYAIDHAVPGSFITVCTEMVSETLNFVSLQQKIHLLSGSQQTANGKQHHH